MLPGREVYGLSGPVRVRIRAPQTLIKKAQLNAGLFNFSSFFGFLATGGANRTEPVGWENRDLPGRAGQFLVLNLESGKLEDLHHSQKPLNHPQAEPAVSENDLGLLQMTENSPFLF